jgi:hypothetical protein
MLAVTNGIAELGKSGTFLYSAIERCEDTGKGVQCSSDLISTIEYVLSASSFIVKGMEACSDGAEKASKCQMTSLKLASASAGLTAASLEMSASCKAQKAGSGKTYPLDDSVPCLGNIAASITSLGSTVAGLVQIKETCKDDLLNCYASSLDILSTIAGMGGAIYASVSGSCIQDKALKPYNECVVATVHAAKSLMSVGSAGLTLSEDCHMAPKSLYEETGKVLEASPFTPVNTALAAFFPLTAVVAFIRGTRDAKNSVSSGEHELVDAQA